MNNVTLGALDEMSRVDIRTVDPDTLVDIREVEVDHELPKEARVLNFIEKIRNPYCFKHGKVIVKIGLPIRRTLLKTSLKAICARFERLIFRDTFGWTQRVYKYAAGREAVRRV